MAYESLSLGSLAQISGEPRKPGSNMKRNQKVKALFLGFTTEKWQALTPSAQKFT
jgi:hypothetical protein